jgi:hypothetical protein
MPGKPGIYKSRYKKARCLAPGFSDALVGPQFNWQLAGFVEVNSPDVAHSG